MSLPRPMSSPLATCCLWLAALAAPSAQAAGNFDPLFGTDGRVVVPLDGRPAATVAALLQPDGGLRVLAQSDRRTGSLLLRLGPGGALENLRFLQTQVRSEVQGMQALALLPDGRLLVAGQFFDGDLVRPRLFAQRLLSDGTPDPSFGQAGRANTQFAGTSVTAEVHKVLVLPSGGLWLLGRINVALDAGGVRAMLWALNADGTPDTRVGPYGQRVLAPLATVNDALLQPEGVIVVGADGVAGTDTVPPALVIARLDARHGDFDPRFGQGGRTTLAAARGEAFTSVVAQPDGRLVAAGNVAGVLAAGVPSPLRLRRFEADGRLDQTLTEPPLTLRGGVRLAQHAGTVWLAGTAQVSTTGDMRLWQLTDSGAIDTGFGNGGVLSADFGALQQLIELLVQPDGKLVLAGWRLAPDGTSDVVLARVAPQLRGAKPRGGQP